VKGRRRMDRLDSTAGPRALVLVWLAEAHAFPTPMQYVSWLLAQRANYWPFELLALRASAQARRTLRRPADWEVAQATKAAVAHTTFLVELVFHLNSLADEGQREADLRCEVLAMHFRALDLEQTLLQDREVDFGTPLAERKEACRAGFSALRTDLETTQEARRLLEARYLEGQSALFPRIAEAWQTTRDMVGGVANLAAEVVGPMDDTGLDTGAALALAGDVADRVRSMALGLIGDTAGARAVAARRLRSRYNVPPKPGPGPSDLEPGHDLGAAR
jgi:hypothetical protein